MSLYGARERGLRRRGRDAGRVGDAEGERAGARLDEEEVGVAVVAALELHDRVAAREAARGAERRHAGLGAARDGAHHLDRRVELDDFSAKRTSSSVGAP